MIERFYACGVSYYYRNPKLTTSIFIGMTLGMG